ncbi:uroporphyrinogen decarboxylase, URO-D [Candidatus Vecturithrix granuli]|uniref:Uroporphyrinogen decarboxylase, URO-D n=1 Tax=Vecturithrix granuli TaxID=1499967 RepID=A0A081C717_VECG1|nr:uroporphyrinogen decarboxylase, URO-D [Candidatus Vecturithrix granuli]
MTEQQWETLLAVIKGEKVTPLPTGFIIDSPWLPNWAGYSILDYFANGDVWFKANMQAIDAFPQTMFLPGFWSEYGMCTEPSAFGAICTWEENEFPFAKPILRSANDVERLELPNPRKDGMLPFMIKRLQQMQPQIENAGHKIRFAVARGPLNIASFLMGASEFLMALKTDREKMEQLLTLISDFLVGWLQYQKECFLSIDGILLLDDIVGFISRRDFQQFGLAYLKKVYDSFDASVKFFHNDAPCKASAPLLAEVGINLLNFGVQHTLSEMQAWADNKITLLGNLPPRDVLASGTPQEVKTKTTTMIEALTDTRRIIFSCGGGMPPGAPTENIQVFLDTVAELTRS